MSLALLLYVCGSHTWTESHYTYCSTTNWSDEETHCMWFQSEYLILMVTWTSICLMTAPITISFYSSHVVEKTNIAGIMEEDSKHSCQLRMDTCHFSSPILGIIKRTLKKKSTGHSTSRKGYITDFFLYNTLHMHTLLYCSFWLWYTLINVLLNLCVTVMRRSQV